jgi:hypothetical protein
LKTGDNQSTVNQSINQSINQHHGNHKDWAISAVATVTQLHLLSLKLWATLMARDTNMDLYLILAIGGGLTGLAFFSRRVSRPRCP